MALAAVGRAAGGLPLGLNQQRTCTSEARRLNLGCQLLHLTTSAPKQMSCVLILNAKCSLPPVAVPDHAPHRETRRRQILSDDAHQPRCHAR